MLNLYSLHLDRYMSTLYLNNRHLTCYHNCSRLDTRYLILIRACPPLVEAGAGLIAPLLRYDEPGWCDDLLFER